MCVYCVTCSLHAVTSSVIYYSAYARKNVIYLLIEQSEHFIPPVTLHNWHCVCMRVIPTPVRRSEGERKSLKIRLKDMVNVKRRVLGSCVHIRIGGHRMGRPVGPTTRGKISQASTRLLAQLVSTYRYSLANRQGSFAYVRKCKTRLRTTTKFMIVVTWLFNVVISSFPDNMFYHVWTWLLIYHDCSNNVVQVCSFIKPWTVCSNMHKKACQQHCSSWPAQPCSSLSTGKNKLCIFARVVSSVRFLICRYLGKPFSKCATEVQNCKYTKLNIVLLFVVNFARNAWLWHSSFKKLFRFHLSLFYVFVI